MKVLLDTSVLIASMVGRHPHHARAKSTVRRVLAGDDRGHVTAHGLMEAYAVLTTLPVTPRIGPEAAAKLIEDNVVEHFAIVSLTAREHSRLVSQLADRGVVGGSTYDAIHLACARKAGVQRVYTFNVADFQRLDRELAERIVAP